MTNMRNVQKDNYGIHILKILCIMWVVGFHYFDHGVVAISTAQINHNWIWLSVFSLGGGICNCVFCLVSGYYSHYDRSVADFRFISKDRISKFFQIWIKVLYYSILTSVIAYSLGAYSLTGKNLIRMFFPLTFNQFWYASTYVIMIIMWPILSLALEKLRNKDLLLFVVVQFFVFSILPTFAHTVRLTMDNNLPMFFTMYSIGYYLKRNERKYINEQLKIISGIAAILMIIIEILSVYVLRRLNSENCRYFVWGMEKSLPVITSILMFIFFVNMKWSSNKFNRIIRNISSYCFGIYLLHTGPLSYFFFKELFNNDELYSKGIVIWNVILCIFVIISCGILFELVFICTFGKIAKKMIAKINKDIRYENT